MAKSKPSNPPANEGGDHDQGEHAPHLIDGETQTSGVTPGDGPVIEGNEPGDTEQSASAGGEERQSETGQDDASSAGNVDQQDVGHGDAPYGLRKDGTPAKKRGPKAAPGVTDTRAAQRDKLRSVTPSKARAKPVDQVQSPTMAVVNYQAMGQAVASMFFSVGTLAFGNDWQPDEQEGEHLAVAGAFRDYFRATNMRDLPPGFALCFVLGVYTLKRAAKPTMSSKLKLFGAWVKSKMPKRKGAGIYPINNGSGLETM